MSDKLEGNILVETNEPKEDDFVLYENDKSEITHGAIYLSNDIVISKWMWRPIIKNGILNFPMSFGDRLIFCKKVESSIIKDEYRKYKNSGVEIAPIL